MGNPLSGGDPAVRIRPPVRYHHSEPLGAQGVKIRVPLRSEGQVYSRAWESSVMEMALCTNKASRLSRAVSQMCVSMRATALSISTGEWLS